MRVVNTGIASICTSLFRHLKYPVIHRKKHAPAILVVLVILSAVSHAQSLDQLTINYIEVSAAADRTGNEVRAYVTVSGPDREPVSGLSMQHFEILEDGRRIETGSVSKTSDPMSVVLVIDTSGSMQAKDTSGMTSMDWVKRAALNFIDLLSDDDRIAIYSFNHHATLHSDFTDDHEAAIRAVNTLAAKPGAATCLYDTTIDAVKKAAEIPRGRRAIILLTDGKDEKAGGKCSIFGINDVIDAATTKTIRVPIYTIGAGPKVDARELARIAGMTGGRNLIAEAMAELSGFYHTIANQLKNQYELTYVTHAPSGEHSLVVKTEYEDTRLQDEKRFWSPPPPFVPPPVVRFIHPESGDKIASAVTIRLHIEPEKSIVKLRYYVDGILKKEISQPPFTPFEWNAESLAPGLHVLRIEAVDLNEQVGAAELTTRVMAPEVAIIHPLANDEVEDIVKIRIRITSEESVSRLACFIDGVLAAENTDGTFETVDVKTDMLSAGPHTLRVEITDRFGRIGSAELPVRKASQGTASRFPWLMALLLLIILLFVWMGFRIRRQKKKAGAIRPIVAEGMPFEPIEGIPEVEDETILVSDPGVKASAPKANLKVIACPGVESGKIFEISGSAKMGRHEGNEIRLPEKSVSRRHAEIYFNGRHFCIRDLGSKYGTTVNDHRISSEVKSLSNRSIIHLGPRITLEFQCMEAEVDEDAMTLQIFDDQDRENRRPDKNEHTQTMQFGLSKGHPSEVKENEKTVRANRNKP